MLQFPSVRLGTTPRGTALLLSLFLCLAVPASAAKPKPKPSWEWPPLVPEELALREELASPGVSAIILNREFFSDDTESLLTSYTRIKVLTDEGKKHADVEIPYLKDWIWLEDLRARTIHPDGRVIEFTGEIHDKVVARYRRYDLDLRAKVFSLPEVETGSILEYRFVLRWKPGLLLGGRWQIQGELYTRRARYALRPFLGPFAFSYVSYLPPGKEVKQQADGTMALEVENVPALVQEEFMPPEESLQFRVQFFYGRRGLGSPEGFWKREGKEWHEAAEKFIGQSKAVEQEARRVVPAADSPQGKLRALYARAQKIRNLSFEAPKTEQEEERAKLKANRSVEHVLKNGYGSADQINLLFVALARAAGFSVDVLRLAERDQVIFEKDYLSWQQLTAYVAAVRTGGEESYQDPGTPFCPFGLLSWEKTAVTGIRLAAEGGAFVQTPPARPEEATIDRQAMLQLAPDGVIAGTLRVVFSGREALERRLQARNTDEPARRKKLEDEVRRGLPAGAEVTLEQAADWARADDTLQAEFTVRIPLVSIRTEHRLLLPVGLLHLQAPNPFPPSRRVQPIHFTYPYEHRDIITLKLPVEHQLESLPEPREKTSVFGRFESGVDRQGDALRLRRRVAMTGLRFPAASYPSLRAFFDAVKSGDEDQIVLAARRDSQP